MEKIISGKAIADEILAELKSEAAGRDITLAVIIVGADPASHIYVKHKKKTCQAIGIGSQVHELSADTSEAKLLALIDELNRDAAITGILLQLPLPPHISEERVVAAIDPQKDVDCFHPINIGNLLLGHDGFMPCTPAGIITLLKRANITIAGKECVIIGRSNIVGKPMALLLLRENATVTITHTKTVDLAAVCRRADILIAAAGRAKLVTADYVKDGAIVIDVGIHRDGKKLCGDVDFDAVYPHVGAITPVPGGIGPMTIAMLMKNCVEAKPK
ncbi:MAG: bifunctional methylenetetrahydrofolate dehydrogenase/methenyltetrahydrofolate cyclohydrolase FolD [Lachnospiraceae bacterium]|jgi:methylenetetrahydrofolate dehydrogenase (NADP+)/methenyltetrahydrofolate cyclohydrolase|nr:bifunctional methylenetetrahydrofolate dehydrogenase/methenyltetrahydrofolate cyclohydrolase FolD [Lachnospiraceae bacterium]